LIYDTGTRVQEIAELTFGDLRTDPPATVKLTGKGNKTRIVPLMVPTVALVQRYAGGADLTGPASGSRSLFSNRGEMKMTRSGIAYILDKHVTAAREADPAALPETISPHNLRHSKAMHLLSGRSQPRLHPRHPRPRRSEEDHRDLRPDRWRDEATGAPERLRQPHPARCHALWHHDKDMLTWLTNIGR
jgi:integrase/recombinase XerD